MSQIKLLTASSGSIALEPTNTASNLVITVPAVTGTMLTNKTAGTVLQVVNAQSTTPTAVNNSTTFSSLSLSASITPTSATSKILVLLSVTGLSSNSAIAGVKIQRNGSDIRTYGFVAHFNSTTGMSHTNGMNYLDSPASTSALTYSVLGNSNQGLTTFQYSDGAGTQVSSITLMEIAA